MKRLLFLVIMSVLIATPRWAEGVATPKPDITKRPLTVEEMQGEDFNYNISFLWFEKLARGRWHFYATDKPGIYKVEMEGVTRGVAAWLTQDRIQRYVSIMELTPAGKLRSISHEYEILRRKNGKMISRIKKFTFNHQRREVTIRKIADGVDVYTEVKPLDADIEPDDIMTACLNFRAGHYGPIVPGAKSRVPTFSQKEGIAWLEIEVMSAQEQARLEFPSKGVLCRIKMDKDIFDTGGGYVYVWFDNQGRPVIGIVENVVGLGNIRGELR